MVQIITNEIYCTISTTSEIFQKYSILANRKIPPTTYVCNSLFAILINLFTISSGSFMYVFM